ncbi:MAG TPA: c-type cytochrome [Mariprofundaceae bacterium]|nr:c-type cytochrome [Mariprofundaceae bacterium]
MIRWLGAILALILVPAALHAEDMENYDGKSLFEANCAMCHGKDGSVSDYGKKLKPFPARNLRAVAPFVERDELRRIITNGVEGTAMTPKKYILDPLQVEAVIDYIKSFTYTPNLANGEKRFKAVCSQCHGMDGRAETGIGAKNLVYTKLDLSGIIHTMRYGRPNTLMTSKRHQLTNMDINDIAHYVYSLRYKADADRGMKLYDKSCKSCHASPSAIKLIGNAAEKRTIADLDDRQLDLRIRHGRHIDRAGKDVTKLSDDDVQDLLAYMRKSTKP